MKRSVVMAVLGLAATVATNTYGQGGGVNIANYQVPFNPIVWSAASGGGRVASTDGVTLALWWGNGASLNESQLAFGMNLTWKTDSETLGYFGYFNLATAVLPTWQTGDTWTFQIRAAGNSVRGAVDPITSRSVLFQETTAIHSLGGTPPGSAGNSSQSVGFTVNVPEPTTFALAGLGAAALMIFRRRS